MCHAVSSVLLTPCASALPYLGNLDSGSGSDDGGCGADVEGIMSISSSSDNIDQLCREMRVVVKGNGQAVVAHFDSAGGDDGRLSIELVEFEAKEVGANLGVGGTPFHDLLCGDGGVLGGE